MPPLLTAEPAKWINLMPVEGTHVDLKYTLLEEPRGDARVAPRAMSDPAPREA